MNVRAFLLGVLLFGAFGRPAFSDIMQQADAPGQAPTPTGTPTTTLPAQSQTQGSAPLRVMVGKSLLINTTERLRRISVTDPAVAYPQVITPTQILVHGKAPGEVSLLIWDELERSRSFDLRVDVDVSACADEEHIVSFPTSRSTVTPFASGHRSLGARFDRGRLQARGRARQRLFSESRERADLPGRSVPRRSYYR